MPRLLHALLAITIAIVLMLIGAAAAYVVLSSDTRYLPSPAPRAQHERCAVVSPKTPDDSTWVSMAIRDGQWVVDDVYHVGNAYIVCLRQPVLTYAP